jgi:hypothetical protein
MAALLAAPAVDAAPTPHVLFKFSSGSGLFARPGLGQTGGLYVGSGDGSVSALGSDGSFRWSYTVKGRVLSPPIEEPASGHVFVATSEHRLYALERDAALRWVFPLPATPKTELVLSPRGTLYFVGQDDHLYGVTTGGALGLRLAAPAARSAPVWLEEGKLGLILADKLGTLQGYGYQRAPLLGGGFDDSAKLALDERRTIFACDGGQARVVDVRGTELRIDGDCTSAPVQGDGFLAVAEAGGVVRLVFTDGSRQDVALGSAPLRPRWDAPRRRLILATATGEVSALELGVP